MTQGMDPRALEILEQWFLAQDEGRECDLAAACGGDLELEAAIRGMIAGGPTWITDPDASHPKRIGPYEVLGPIARGGMGAIFRCRCEADARIVAVKILDAQYLPDPTSKARFRREAELTASLDHENIVQVFGVGESEGRVYIAMEYLEGPALNQLDGQAPRDVAELGARVADALDAAHLAGVVHRDVKPANILMHRGRPVLVDFGLAKSAANPSLTRTGTVPGTLHYLAPELLHSRGAALDPRTDVYSLGATLYELVAGHPPFREEDPDQLIRDILLRQPPPLRLTGDARQLEVLIFACLSKDPAHRPRDAGFLAKELRRVAASRSIETRRPSTATRLWRLARRFPRAAVTTAVAMSLSIALGSWLWTSAAQAAERRTRTYADVRQWAAAGDHERVVDALRVLEVEAVLPESMDRLQRISLAEMALTEVIGRLNARVESADAQGLSRAVARLERQLASAANDWGVDREQVAAAAMGLAGVYLGDDDVRERWCGHLPDGHPMLVALACDMREQRSLPVELGGLGGDLALLVARALHLEGAALEQVEPLALRALESRPDAGLFLAELHRRRGNLTRAEEILLLLAPSPARTRVQAGIHLWRNETDRVRALLPSVDPPSAIDEAILLVARQRDLTTDPMADWGGFIDEVRAVGARHPGVGALLARLEAMAHSRGGDDAAAVETIEAVLGTGDPIEFDHCRAALFEFRRRSLPRRLTASAVRELERAGADLLDGDRRLRDAEARAMVHFELAHLAKLLGEADSFRANLRAAMALRPYRLMEPVILLEFEVLSKSAVALVRDAQRRLEAALDLVLRERLPIAEGGEAHISGVLRRAAAITDTEQRVEELAARLR